MLGHHHPFAHVHAELGIGHIVLSIVQDGDPFPQRPFLLSLTEEGEFLAHGNLLLIPDTVIAHDGQLTSLGQILVYLDDGIDLLDAGIVVYLGSRDTGRPTIARLVVVLVEDPVFIQLIPDDMQEVVVEDIGISPFDDQRTIGLVFDAGKFRTEVIGEFGTLRPHRQTAIILRHFVEHRLPYQLEHLVLGAFTRLLHTIHGWS